MSDYEEENDHGDSAGSYDEAPASELESQENSRAGSDSSDSEDSEGSGAANFGDDDGIDTRLITNAFVRHGQQDDPNVERITPNFLTKYERARVIGTRALQISKNAPILVDLAMQDIDPILIAEKELYEKKIPFVIRRHLHDGTYEDWKLSELNLIDRY